MIVEFKRSDGIVFSADEGSAAFELMEKDGAFIRLDAEGVEAAEPDGEDLSKLNKKQLYGLAATRDVPVTDKMTKAEIIAAIEAAAEGSDEE